MDHVEIFNISTEIEREFELNYGKQVQLIKGSTP